MTNVWIDLEPELGPLGGLPPADRTLLGSAPLEVAIVEVRFTSSESEIAADTATRLRDLLEDGTEAEYPSIQPATQGTMQIDFGSPGSAWSGDQTKGWQIASVDGRRNVTLLPGSLIIQTSDYERWSVSLRNPLEIALDVISAHLKPSLVHRIGLRYVDRFADSECRAVSDWEGRIDDALLGPVRNGVFGSKVRGAQQQIELEVDSRHGAILRHGPSAGQTNKSVDYLLDLDVFSHITERFSKDAVLNAAVSLNRTSLSLFQACVSAGYLKSLQREGGNS